MSLRQAAPVALGILTFIGAACSGAPPAPPPPRKILQPEVSAAIHYEVRPHEGGAALSVVATLPPGLPPELRVDQSMITWVKSPEIETEGGWSKLPFSGETWQATGCERGCRVRYEYDLAAAAGSWGDVSYAAVYSGAYLAPPSTWLLHPDAPLSNIPYRFHVTSPPGVEFVTGVYRASGENGTFGADISDLPDAPYSAFGRFEALRARHGGGEIEIAVMNNPFPRGNRLIEKWIEDSANAVIAYYGKFPLAHAAILLIMEGGDDLGSATTTGNGGGAIVAHVGVDTPEKDLLHSWQMTHEMMHLSFPNLPRAYHWLEEGMATYVEPVARARAGALTETEVWSGMVRGMPFGLPAEGQGGLDDTPTWGRIYWGGALYCLLADVRIHEQTNNAKGLDDALVAILDQGGNIGARWDIDRVIEVGDRATGTRVLHDLHEQMGRAPMSVDLADLWARLGVRRKGREWQFDDGAPLASVRRAILSRPPRSNAPTSGDARSRN